jgi:hypothetical protein
LPQRNKDVIDVRIKFASIIALLALSLAGTVALADPPQKKKPTYPPPEQSSTVGTLGQPHRDPNAPAQPREPSAPLAAPELPKVEAEPPMPSTAPENYVVRPDIGAAPADSAGGSGGTLAPMMRAPMGPPPTGFLPDHPFISGIVAGLVGADLGARLYGGPMMGDQDGVIIGYLGRVGVILLLAWMVFRLIARKASGVGEPGLAPPGRREPSFDRQSDAGSARREPTLRRRD